VLAMDARRAPLRLVAPRCPQGLLPLGAHGSGAIAPPSAGLGARAGPGRVEEESVDIFSKKY
jgi:hypothetical protein